MRVAAVPHLGAFTAPWRSTDVAAPERSLLESQLRDWVFPAEPPPLLDLELDREGFQWLHDKYERLQMHEEGTLASVVTSFYVLQGLLATLLVGFTVSVHSFYESATIVQLVSSLGVFSAIIGWGMTSRTSIACDFWRESLWELESQVNWKLPKVAANFDLITRPFRSFAWTFHETPGHDRRVAALMVPTLNAPFVCKWVGIAWALVLAVSSIAFVIGPGALAPLF